MRVLAAVFSAVQMALLLSGSAEAKSDAQGPTPGGTVNRPFHHQTAPPQVRANGDNGLIHLSLLYGIVP
ncbi:hypothetical protein Q1695_015055 [Nippostrongylus brasiliensis]|nr:hypothetical protein Q1695_015055 [Nippostrongylus brasiliensis]